jgi:hypothetical protein
MAAPDVSMIHGAQLGTAGQPERRIRDRPGRNAPLRILFEFVADFVDGIGESDRVM